MMEVQEKGYVRKTVFDGVFGWYDTLGVIVLICAWGYGRKVVAQGT
jgi:hypothetical protein